MRLGHIIVSVHITKSVIAMASPEANHSVLRASLVELTHFVLCIVLNASDHSGEVIPVPIPNTEVKLSYVDDTGFVPGK